MKRQSTEWEKIFSNDKTNIELISKIYKQLIQLNIKTKTPTFHKWEFYLINYLNSLIRNTRGEFQ